MTEELKPCPFCGYDLQEDDKDNCFIKVLSGVNSQIRGYKVKCPYCDASGSEQHTKEDAIKVWNTRKERA